MPLQIPQAHRLLRLKFLKDGKPALKLPFCPILTTLKASAVGGSPTQVVLRATNDWQVAMGYSNRACRTDTINNSHIYWHWSFAATILETINKQPTSWAGKHTGRADRLIGGRRENFRRELNSLCLRESCKSGTDGWIELSGCPA